MKRNMNVLSVFIVSLASVQAFGQGRSGYVGADRNTPKKVVARQAQIKALVDNKVEQIEALVTAGWIDAGVGARLVEQFKELGSFWLKNAGDCVAAAKLELEALKQRRQQAIDRSNDLVDDADQRGCLILLGVRDANPFGRGAQKVTSERSLSKMPPGEQLTERVKMFYFRLFEIVRNAGVDSQTVGALYDLWVSECPYYGAFWVDPSTGVAPGMFYKDCLPDLVAFAKKAAGLVKP